MNKITINGKTFNNLQGDVTIINGKVFVDGKQIGEEEKTNRSTKIEIIGDVKEVIGVESLIVNSSVNGNVKTHGSLQIDGKVLGNVQCGGGCIVNGEVKGDIKATGSIIVNK